MSRPSRVLTVSASLALALLPAGYAASNAFADDAAAPATVPAFTLTQTASGFDLAIVGTGAVMSFNVGPDGSVEAADSEADAPETDLPAATPATTGGAAGSQQAAGTNNDSSVDEGQQGPDEQQGDNNDDQGETNDAQGANNAQQGPDDQAGDQQGPNDQSGSSGDGGSSD